MAPPKDAHIPNPQNLRVFYLAWERGIKVHMELNLLIN